jgi:TonB family protein
MEAIRAELEAIRAEAETQGPVERPDPGPDAARQAGPVFTPMTVWPEIINRPEVVAALMREYPAALRDAGVEGTVEIWFFISEQGRVEDTRISRTSGQAQFDDAALRVADVFRFTSAMNRGDPAAVWIQVPITFQVR